MASLCLSERPSQNSDHSFLSVRRFLPAGKRDSRAPVEVAGVLENADQQRRQIVAIGIRVEIDPGKPGRGANHRPIPHRDVDPKPLRQPLLKLVGNVARGLPSASPPEKSWQWLDGKARAQQFGDLAGCHRGAFALRLPRLCLHSTANQSLRHLPRRFARFRFVLRERNGAGCRT